MINHGCHDSLYNLPVMYHSVGKAAVGLEVDLGTQDTVACILGLGSRSWRR